MRYITLISSRMSDTPAAAGPSKGRWYILLLISVMYLITYLDRVNISTAAPEIIKEFGFDKVTMGVIFSAFLWSYALFQVPGGWLSDKFGARRVLAGVVTFWSLMTAATGLVAGATSFKIVRFLFGVGEAGAFPGATRAMQLWYPRSERGFVQGITHSASRAGAALAPPIVLAIMLNFGWRAAFFICGGIGLLWSIWWALSYRNLPEDHGMVNRTELEHIRGVDASGAINPPQINKQMQVPWGRLLSSGNMWAVMCAYFTYVYCLWIFLSWLTTYLIEVRHFTLLKGGLLASLPLWAGVIGDTAGGLATDYLLRRTGSAKIARRTVAITGLLGCAVFIMPAALTEDADDRRRLSHRLDVLSGMHHRPVLGGADGYRRQIFRHGVRHDEHGRQFRRRHLADRVRHPGAKRQLGSPLHRCRGAPRRRLRGLGVLDRSRQGDPRRLAAKPR